MSTIKLKWEPRQEQIDILEKFKTVVDKKKKFFIVDSPVGTGKSYVVMMMAHYFSQLYPDSKYDLLTNSKILQDQYLRDFHFIASLKGKENYNCHAFNCSCSEGMELAKIENRECRGCPYAEAKTNYLNSEIGVLNFHLFTSFFIYVEDFLTQRKSKILFIDEAHAFEEVYCDFISTYITIPYIENLGIQLSDEMKFKFNTIHSSETLADFLRTFIVPKLLSKLTAFASQVSNTTEHSKKIFLLKEYRKISRTKCKLNRFLNDEKNWKDNWIYEKGTNEEGLYHKADAIWGKRYLNEIWDKYDHIVFLSGTILDKMMFSNLMNVDLNSVSFVTLDSPFKPENRKIYLDYVGSFSFSEIEKSFEKSIPKIKEILTKHKGQKGIIHTGNYKLANWLKEKLKDDRLLFHDFKTREISLNKHILSEKDTVIVSPSMMNGVDLKDDLSRFQIILKIPFPQLENEKIKKRMSTSKQWYSWKTLLDLIQSYGRSVRSEQDYADTYILDSNFEILRKNINIPKYIRDAIQIVLN